MIAAPAPLVGRGDERAALADALRSLHGGTGRVVVLAGEPGIGKTRLLAELAAQATAGGWSVRAARASEFEADLPYALFADALGAEVPAGADRHATHRALRDELAQQAAARPLVLCLDDVQWADPASLDALAALVRRPPAGPVLLALAARTGGPAPSLDAALDAARREERVTSLALRPLSEAEAAELVGEAAATVYELAGGNPFYLEQLARVADRPSAAGRGDGTLPDAVAAALTSELAALTPEARALLEGAAVAGDPFDLDLAAAIAELAGEPTLRSLDELLAVGLVRPADAPRQFAFRHPVLRHAVDAATPRGRQLGAHARAAAALEARGASPLRRAHHVEHVAQPGDRAAVDVLVAAAHDLQAPAPAAAARYFAAALRLVTERDEARPERLRLSRQLADAQAAAGDPQGARETLVRALRDADVDDRLMLTVALANQEWWLGGHEQARSRLHVALGDLPAQPSPDRVRLRLALALTALMACDLPDAAAQASDARDDARAIGDPVFEAAALAAGALAAASAGDRDAAVRLDESAAALHDLSAGQLATRLPAFWMHGRARRALGQFTAALADLEQGAAIAADTGRERIQVVLVVESVPALVELGQLVRATASAEDGLERARLASNPRLVLWAQAMLATAHLAAGDVATALVHAGEATAAGVEADFHAAGQPGWALGAALGAAGNPDRAVAVLAGAFGPGLAHVLPSDRPAAAADLVDAHLTDGDLAAAAEAFAHGERAAAELATPWAATVTGRVRSALLLAGGEADDAVRSAAAAREAADGAPLAAARARLAEGRALAATGQRAAAVQALRDAETELHGFGAERLRADAARELRRLGHRVVRAPREQDSGPLTSREREIAELVAAGRTNREVAGQLVVSTRTVEAHLRSIYGKLDVRSRVELARELQRLGDG